LILPRVRVIELGLLSSAFLSFVELSYVELGEGESLFDESHAAERDAAVASFARYVYDRHDQEQAYCDGLGYVLNLSPERFAALLPRLKVRFPTQRDPAEIRRFLVLLWDRLWATPDVDGFEPDAYEINW
jgi:hypothetical protein